MTQTRCVGHGVTEGTCEARPPRGAFSPSLVAARHGRPWRCKACALAHRLASGWRGPNKGKRAKPRMMIAAQGARFTAAQLAFFIEPRTWPEILQRFPELFARGAIIAADEYGAGWLVWNRRDATWHLTARGMAAMTAGATRGAA